MAIMRIPDIITLNFTITADALDKKSGAMIIAINPNRVDVIAFVAMYNGTDWVSTDIGSMSKGISVEETSTTSEEITYTVTCTYAGSISPTKAAFIPPPGN